MFQWSLKAMARMPHLEASYGNLDHILRAVNEIRKGMDMTIDRTLEQLVFNARIDLQLSGLSFNI
jgi:hypothetical protein